MNDYSEIVRTVVKKFIETQGEEFVVAQANKSEHVEIDEHGGIISLEDGEKALEDIMNQFNNVMGPVAYALAARALEDQFGSIDREVPEELRQKIKG